MQYRLHRCRQPLLNQDHQQPKHHHPHQHRSLLTPFQGLRYYLDSVKQRVCFRAHLTRWHDHHHRHLIRHYRLEPQPPRRNSPRYRLLRR